VHEWEDVLADFNDVGDTQRGNGGAAAPLSELGPRELAAAGHRSVAAVADAATAAGSGGGGGTNGGAGNASGATAGGAAGASAASGGVAQLHSRLRLLHDSRSKAGLATKVLKDMAGMTKENQAAAAKMTRERNKALFKGLQGLGNSIRAGLTSAAVINALAASASSQLDFNAALHANRDMLRDVINLVDSSSEEDAEANSDDDVVVVADSEAKRRRIYPAATGPAPEVLLLARTAAH
jgi:hypothetical protein